MIDEMAEVRAYLNGKKPTPQTQYRCAYLLARYYVAQGMDERDATRAILRWGQSVGCWFNVQVSQIVYYAIHKPRPLRDGVVVYINDEDVSLIKALFHKPKIQTLALGLIAYAKAMADDEGVFDISIIGLADWLQLPRSSVNRWLDMMIDAGFVQKIFQKKRSKKIRTPSTRLQLLYPISLHGRYPVRENAVVELASELFQK